MRVNRLRPARAPKPPIFAGIAQRVLDWLDANP
jgi:hypothetical protein